MDESSSNPANTLRERAHMQRRNRDLLLAEQTFKRLLAAKPDDTEALQFIASQHLSRGESPQALELLTRAHLASPDDPAILNQLGTVQMGRGDFTAAVDTLRRCLALAPNMFMARLRVAIALEQLGESHDALLAYFNAIQAAQAQGRWLSDASTAPDLRATVKRAMDYIDAGRRALFDAVIEPLRQRYGRSELARVDECLAIYLHERPANLPDPRQAPKFLYFPGVPAQPYYPRERFPWQAALEAGAAAIREELRTVMADEGNLESFLQTGLREEIDGYLRASGNQAAAWDAFFFYRHGTRYDAHCERCPQTAAMLESAELVKIRDHAPETLFSVLRPGTHILPHRGVTNTRLVTHLPLIVPPDCALRVGGDIHVWQPDRCVTFDDTFEHEAWNRSSETRVVLILDSWNPDLSEAERAAVADLVAAIGDFNASAAA
ncbi:MAG TPA: aspartyl/asparaginyl beta-hydroxylase domain-containing protein [Rhodanobacter sp.]|nr:aspartyl/asparaginyl beta-hydroxylase domain-containing protein [Rhodanobacter sp.]